MRSVTMDFLKKVLEAKCCNNYQEKRFERIVMQACTEFDFLMNRTLDTLGLLYMMLSEVGEVHERVLMHPRIQVMA